MSNKKVVIDTLLEKRNKLIMDRKSAIERLDSEIKEIEDAVDELDGKRVWRLVQNVDVYQDEHPDYIRQSQEEI